MATKPPSSARYEVLELLGRGGMGEVYRARRIPGGEPVALKVLRPESPRSRQEVAFETQTLARLHHEGIVQLVDVAEADGALLIAMELLDGVPLSVALGRPPASEAEVMGLLRALLCLLDALEHVHERGLVHGDLKPSNILLLPEGAGAARGLDADSVWRQLASGGARLKLIDFGLARRGGQSGAAPGGNAASGTPLYMAPEALRGDPLQGALADLYSLGALAYHLLTGQPPCSSLAETLSPRRAVVSPRALQPLCPVGLERWLLGLLEPSASRRPPSARAAQERLEELLDPGTPGRLARARVQSPAYLERTVAEAALLEALEGALAGRGGAVILQGEEGSGKTWLLERGGLKRKAVVERGLQCVHQALRLERDSGNVVRGLLEAMVPRLLARDGERARAALAPWGGRLLELAGIEARADWPTARLQEDDPSSGGAPGALLASGYGPGAAAREPVRREQALTAALRLVEEAAALDPWLILVDDVDLSSELELELLRRLAHRAARLPILMVLTLRTESAEGAPALARWLGDLSLDETVRNLSMARWTDGETARVAASMLQPRGSTSPALALELSRSSEGHAATLVERVTRLFDAGRLRLESGQWTLDEGARSAPAAADLAAADLAAADLAGPASLEPLGEEALRVLAALTILGPGHDAPALAALTGASSERAQSALRELESKGLVLDVAGGGRPTRALQGGQPLHAALLERVGAATIRALHGRQADRLLAQPESLRKGVALRIAVHLEEAGRAREAAQWFVEAARTAARAHANRRGLQALEKAITLLGSEGADPLLLAELGDLQSRVGDYPAALASYGRALEKTPGAAARGALLERSGRVHQRRGDFGEARASFERSLEAAGEDPQRRARALLCLGGAGLEMGDLARAQRHLEESVELLATTGDHGALAAAQTSLGLVEKNLGRIPEATERLRLALQSARASGSRLEAACALNNLANLLRAAGDTEAAIERLEESIAVREQIGDRQGLAVCKNNIARAHVVRGDLRKAQEATRHALEAFTEIGDKKGVSIALCNLAEIAQLLGDLPGARELLARSRQAAERLQLRSVEAATLLNEASLCLDHGLPEEAALALERARPLLVRARSPELRLQGLTLSARAAMASADLERAEEALREAGEAASEARSSESRGHLAALQVALLVKRGEPEAAVELGKRSLGQGEPALEALGAAALRLELGVAFRELGPDWADQTEKHLEAARLMYRQMGSPHNEAAAEAELATYWHLLGEDDLAVELFQAAAARLRACGATRRLEELGRRARQLTRRDIAPTDVPMDARSS